jgi:hypothetical protein
VHDEQLDGRFDELRKVDFADEIVIAHPEIYFEDVTDHTTLPVDN